MNKRTLLHCALALATVPLTFGAAAQDFPPKKPVTLVVGFAAETDNVLENATAKRARKGCDWIVANDVTPATGIMGGTENAVTLISDAGAESWPRLSKDEVAHRLAARLAGALDHAGDTLPGDRT